MHEPSLLFFLPFLWTIYLSLNFFFFFNDPFADQIFVMCKQLQNETGIFNLQMGVPCMSKKAEHGTVLLVFFFSFFLSSVVFEGQIRLDFRWAFTSDSSDNFVALGCMTLLCFKLSRNCTFQAY